MSEEKHEQGAAEFDRLAHEKRPSIATEFWYFLMHNKKWWLLPIVLMIILLGALVLLGGSGLAPFIYPLF
ncbi:MAG TPA: DUF5989 family protein [Anaerohalosphaeraceae bacterium]|jgi:hypothetical protein|nr:DUF5989 family protein [Anaerohalosphaeraceae bacterium]HRT51368.1 DUF5989 family protein [Anaerohalosphaeraceae bacterium]HRT87317.1 DUF5989 family protein [Anaerohalosphaeraceae bacterium]